MSQQTPSTESKKQAFLKKDRLVRGITEDGFFKVAVAKTTEVVRDAKRRHGLSLLSTVLLGKTLTGAMLLAADLKGEERVQVRMEGNGPVGALIAEANHAGEIRGYVRNPQASLEYTSGTPRLEDGIGIGLFHFTKVLFEEAHPVTGTVIIAHGNISGDFAHYLVNSEQIPSAILLDVGIDAAGDVEEAGGVIVQALPGAPLDQIKIIEQNIARLSPLGEKFRDGETIDSLMHKVLEPLPAKELTRHPLHFFCRCTKDRFKDALVTLGIRELQELQNEPQELICHYCNEKYVIPPHEIQELISGLQ